MCPLVYNIDLMANPEGSVKNGAIEVIRRMGEIQVYAARYFDNHVVALGPGITGKAPAHHLKSSNGRLRPLYDAYKIPGGFPNRLCIGADCLTWGGRDKEDDHVLSESDFSACDPNDFDKYVAPSTWAMEAKSESSQHIETFRTNALNMSRMFPAIYCAEYIEEREKRIEHLGQMHLSYPRKYPLGFFKNVRGALNVRCAHDLNAMADTIMLHARAGRPTFQKLQAVSTTIVSPTCATLFRRPDTFDITIPTSYFFRDSSQTER